MKDKNGSYFCIPCGKADSQKKHSVGTPCKDCWQQVPRRAVAHAQRGQGLRRLPREASRKAAGEQPQVPRAGVRGRALLRAAHADRRRASRRS
jgi:hypothetical protein